MVYCYKRPVRGSAMRFTYNGGELVYGVNYRTKGISAGNAIFFINAELDKNQKVAVIRTDRLAHGR